MTYRNLVGLQSAEPLRVLALGEENDRRCQDREPGTMPSRTARILAAEIYRAITTETPWTMAQLLGITKEIMGGPAQEPVPSDNN